MTVLSVIQRAAVKALGIPRPSSIFSSDERDHAELADVAQEMADEIARAHEWSTLKRQYVLTGNSVTDAFALPDDYDRMPKSQQLWTSRFDAPLEFVQDSNVWMRRLTRDFQLALGSWTMLGGDIVFNPVLGTGETARFYYLTNECVIDTDFNTKRSFTSDDDTFRLDEDLLRLGIIWKWKANKGLPAEDELVSYEDRLADRVARDRGPMVIRIGRAAYPNGIELAYPRSIIP